MSAPAQVTEAHRQAAVSIFELAMKSSHHGAPFREPCAQFIADSEGKACNQLRAVFPKILAALGNGACCAPDVSVEFIQSIPNEVAGVVAQLRAEVEQWELSFLEQFAQADSAERELEQAVITRDATCIKISGRLREARAEVERLKSDGAASAFIDMACRASRAETDRNNLRADLDAIKAILTEEKARAERAEASLHALRLVCGTTDADKFSKWVDRANTRAEKAEAELAAEREKVRVLREACERIEEQWDKNHSANPFHAGNVMQSHAMRALAATEEAQ